MRHERHPLATTTSAARLLAYGCAASAVPLTIIFSWIAGWKVGLLLGAGLPLAVSVALLAPVMIGGAGIIDAKSALDARRTIRTRERLPAAGQISVAGGQEGGELSEVDATGALSPSNDERE